MPRLLTRLLAPAAVAAALLLSAAPASAAGPGGGDCPGSFLLYQPAPAGPIFLAANSYTISVINLSCANASRALDGFIGRETLPAGWTASVPTKTYFGTGGSFSVSAPRASSTPSGEPNCPSFSLLSRARLDPVVLLRGQYAVHPGGEEPLTCLAAARLIVRIVDDPAGELPGSWSARQTHGLQPGAVLTDSRGRRVELRRISGATVGGGHTSPG